MKLTKNTIRELIKEELSIIKEAEITIPDEQVLEKEYSKIRKAFQDVIERNPKLDRRSLGTQLAETIIEYEKEIRDIEEVVNNWRRLIKNTYDLFNYVTRGGMEQDSNLNAPKFREMSDEPLGPQKE
jgi:cell fate (sporulation/competence/biofilm development) regulator YmcA (YheA/YmcA/DUF963 family)